MLPQLCKQCGNDDLIYDSTLGSTACINCGLVLEESAIVNDITFTEGSNGAQHVTGSFVGANATGTRMMGPSGRAVGAPSAEMTKQESMKKMKTYQHTFSVPDSAFSVAERHLNLAYSQKFTKGRHIDHVIAVCLYMGCKQMKTSHMLIDFADKLRVNVFALGSTYLKWLRALEWEANRTDIIDASIYISRFVALLEFGEDQHRVALDATRIAARFKEDWIAEGRRTSGICGAAIYLAAKMNNYRRSIQEIVQVVKIADTTIVKRLEEFNATSLANLSVLDFRSFGGPEVNPKGRTDMADPPSFTRARIKEREEEEGPGADMIARRGRRRKRKRRGDGSDYDDSDDESLYNPPGSLGRRTSVGAVGETGPGARESAPGQGDGTEALFTPASPVLRPEPTSAEVNGRQTIAFQTSSGDKENDPGEGEKEVLEKILVDPREVREVEDILESSAGQEALALARTNALTRQTQQPADQTTVHNHDDGDVNNTTIVLREEGESVQPDVLEDDLTGLDEEELDGYICSPEEAGIKERVWTEFNLDYLRKLAARRLQDQTGEESPKKKKRKAKKKEPFQPGQTALESVQKMMNGNKQISKRINYTALKGIFPAVDEKDDEDEKMDEKMDEELDYHDKMFYELVRRRVGVEEDEIGEGDYYEQEA